MIYGKFKDFVIEDVAYLGKVPENDKYTYALAKTGEHGGFVIGYLVWDTREQCFEFKGVGMRYQEYSVPGLDGWLLKWTELKTFEHNNMEEYSK